MIKVSLAGITGWTGEAVAKGVSAADDMQLVGAVARKTVGKDAGEILGLPPSGLRIVSTVSDALEGADVFVEYTSAMTARENVMTAISKKVNVVVGSSGLTAADYAEIEKAALANNVGVIAAGNFSITAALAKRFSLMAAEFLPQWEIVDYAHAEKPDVPSGTTRELAEEMAKVRANSIGVSVDKLKGPKEARGAQVEGTPVHSLRLPSFVLAFETIFGAPNERLTIRHDAGNGAEPYVDGTLLAIRKVMSTKGLIRGLDNLLFGKAV